MTEIVKETVTVQNEGQRAAVVTETKRVATVSQTIEYLVYFFFSVVILLLAFRFVLMLIGASTASSFVTMLYGVTGIFIMPFEGIFRQATTQGVETRSVFEPATLIAIVVYAVLSWGIIKLLRIFSGEKPVVD